MLIGLVAGGGGGGNEEEQESHSKVGTLLGPTTNKGSCPKTQISIHPCGKVRPKIYAMQNAKGPKDCQINKV